MKVPVRIGRADCNECGAKGSVCLIIDHMGIWSYCRNCGFKEWEWTWGDSRDYLEYLAEHYHVEYKKLIEVLYEVYGVIFI